MEGLNLHMLNATIGSDVDYREFEGNDKAVASFSVATNRNYKNRDGEKQTDTQWHKVECWNKLAKFANEHLKKGNNIHVQGEVRTDKSEKDGVTRYFTKTLANRITFLPTSGANSQNASPSEAKEQVSNLKSDNTPQPNVQANTQSNTQSNTQGQSVTANQSAFNGDGDDDLPF
jgi:single-strand DNA-binding protein|tara:strand:- start:13327 stop:13848 length:522 start_codon:yes stop_codon:yes gene_type:complete